ncbi:MAG: endolytic transglycosylase MltG [Betaproteobacteria bacterium]
MTIVVRVLALLMLAALGLGAAFIFYAPRLGKPVELYVKPGTNVRTIARELRESGVIVAAEPFLWLMRIARKDGAIKAGSYEFEGAMSPLAVLDMLTAGDDLQLALTIVEGWTFGQMRTALAADPQIGHTLDQGSQADMLRRVGVAEANPEGLFFPDTYHYAPGSADVTVFRRAYRAMQDRLQAGWAGRDQDLPYASPYEALIMASIIEKETGKKSDRKQIASVFVNRLRLGMKLQTDPSVIYGMGQQFNGNLRKRDLEADTPYNTYVHPGLPPTPIALPGQASLDAALHPDPTRYLYFVARGDGSSHFSTTLDEHNRAVNKYQRGAR